MRAGSRWIAQSFQRAPVAEHETHSGQQMQTNGRFLAVNMPWASLDRPSLALGLIRNVALASGEVSVAETLHANLMWAQWLLQEVDTPIQPAEYDEQGLDNYFLGFGDWIFTSALYDQPWKVEEFREYATASGTDPAAALRLHDEAPRFIASLANHIVETFDADIVGFTTTFQQTIASLAVAKEIKKLRPNTRIVMGGANCDGEQGEAVQRNYPSIVDFVLRGEGEDSLPQLLAAINSGRGFEAVPGLCWTNGHQAVSNDMNPETVDLSNAVPPSYDEYFALLESTGLDRFVLPSLVLESSRGCWWGQKHHCTFCGLNGTYMKYRAKGQEQFLAEFEYLVQRHQVLDVYVVDNILDMKYFQRFLPELAAKQWNLHIQYEIKSSLRRHQLQALHDAGAVSLQPGIESLDTRVLKIMDKGVTGAQNIRLLREAENVGLDISWNYLYGFPGETEEDYLPILDQVPALLHLQPPRVASPIAVERFSPYFSDPGLGFEEIVPARYYSLIFDLPIGELFDLAYLFDTNRQGLQGEAERRLQRATNEWRDKYYDSRFVEWDLDDSIVLVSRRDGIDWTTRTLTDATELALYRLLHEPTTIDQLVAAAPEVDRDAIVSILHEWVADGVVFHNAGQYLTLATEPSSIDVVSNSALQRDFATVGS